MRVDSYRCCDQEKLQVLLASTDV
ncbi:hypothetical protein PMIN01_01172 [Paraphaeosphaeria minitans]|uniref:Uncharacterized protein n=1 Tax=Paraphaeosphaeria minitans TaxID=565426 RepID=A0A9P6GU83_9PLEO|nr:hypothetical protein PMIN01_01172 [Paraphaeosphaeria minitans]